MENTEQTKEEEKKEEPKKEEPKEDGHEELRLSGDDIMTFFRKIFKAGNSRSVVWRDDDNEKVLRINLILMALICFIIPVLALIAILILILMNHSVSIEKKKGV